MRHFPLKCSLVWKRHKVDEVLCMIPNFVCSNASQPLEKVILKKNKYLWLCCCHHFYIWGNYRVIWIPSFINVKFYFLDENWIYRNFWITSSRRLIIMWSWGHFGYEWIHLQYYKCCNFLKRQFLVNFLPIELHALKGGPTNANVHAIEM